MLVYDLGFNLLTAHFLHQIEYFSLRHDFAEQVDHVIQRPCIVYDERYKAADVLQVRDARLDTPIIHHRGIIWPQHGVGNFARWGRGKGDLIPIADVDDGVRKSKIADVLINNLFLEYGKSVSLRKHPKA